MAYINWTYLNIILMVGVVASTYGTKILLHSLRERHILDRPNVRSNHQVPVPRGGGIAIVAIILPALLITYIAFPMHISGSLAVLLGMIMLALISFMDDVQHVPARWRFLIQVTSVALVMSFVPEDQLVFQGLLPSFLDKCLATILWVWFINLYNFMDGIDGLAGVETICLGIGIMTLTALVPLPPEMGYYSAIIIAATIGFLVWNWHPAKIFMGDVGSVPLGFMLGWLLLHLSMEGQWAAALILPGYYLADSTSTLIRRIIQGKPFWEGHSEHAYQQAVRRGKAHNQVVIRILTTNILLILLALLSSVHWIYAIISLGLAGYLIYLQLHQLTEGK